MPACLLLKVLERLPFRNAGFKRMRTALLIPLFLLTITCASPHPGKTAVRMTLAGSPATMAYLPHSLAQQLGFYEGQGLAVTAEAVSGGTKGVQALLGGSADVVAGYYDHTIRMAAQGQSIRSFVTLTQYPGNVVIVSPVTRKNIRQFTDLAGAIVGVTDQGSQSHLFLNYLLVRHGLKSTDVTASAPDRSPPVSPPLSAGVSMSGRVSIRSDPNPQAASIS